ncbi:IS4 family transposase, partial [Legionella quinlivanii]|uniref:IS4 family transposase n=1 Tax=Legionella quinlivanii TaxID=45073 RepID=UPI0015591EE4
MDTISNIPQKIFNFLSQTSEQLGKETKYKKRQSKLTPSGFIRALISTSFAPFFDLDTFCDFLKKQGITIRKQSLHERFNKHTEAFVKAMSAYFLNYFQTEKLPMLNGLEIFSGLKLIDSSSISLHSALNNLFQGCGGAASSAALKIQLQFDYLQGQINELTLTSGSDNDQGFDNYFNEIQKGALYLMDLGYFKLSSFKKIIEGEAFFVSRLLTGTKLLTLDKQPLDLLASLSTSGQFFSQELLLGAQYKIPVRLVAQRLPKEIADRRRQRLKEDHRRRGSKPSQESLALQDWSIYITNTSESQIKQEHIHQTYALRWQIELVFKLSKSLMQIHLMNTTKSSRVVVQTYGKFLGLMLFFLLCSPVRAKNHNNIEFSFYKACKLLIINVSELASALVSVYRLKSFIHSFY